MRDLTPIARFYILLVFGLGVVVALLSTSALVADPSQFLSVILITVLIAIFDVFTIPFRRPGIDILISTAIKLAGVILVPPPVILLATFCGTIVDELRVRRVWYKLIFNVGAHTVTFTIVAFVFHLLYQPEAQILGSARNVAALLSMGIADIVANSMLVSTVIALAGRLPVRYVWAENFRPVIWSELSLLPISVFIAVLWKATPWSVALVVAPLFLARHSYKLVVDLEWQTREALQALARVLDERDEQTSSHSELVSKYAGIIASAMGLSISEVDVITRAAWLHDIGKVGMRNDILYKPGALTAEERELAKRHAAIGGELLKKFPLFKKGAIYVRHHHEWWNGTGYPDGLAGEAIPVGARILAVADAYQAMTDDRPYRRPLSEKDALEELRRGAGIQFDPRVVEALFRAKGLTMSPCEAEDDKGLTLPPHAAEENKDLTLPKHAVEEDKGLTLSPHAAEAEFLVPERVHIAA